MRKLTNTIYLTLVVLLGSVGVNGNVFAQTVDFAVKITTRSMHKSIYITTREFGADESWKVLGGCSNQPNLTVYITTREFGADKSIYITSSFLADRTVCITNLRDLDAETLRTLGF